MHGVVLPGNRQQKLLVGAFKTERRSMYKRTQKESAALLRMQAAIVSSGLAAKAVVWNETHGLPEAMSEAIDVYIQIESLTINRLFDAEYVLRRDDAVLASDLVGAVADFTQQQAL